MEISRLSVPDSMSVSRINEKDDSPRRLVIFFVFAFLFKFGAETGIWNGWGIDDE